MTNSVDAALKIAADLRKAERRVDRDPTDAQKSSGNYTKGHLKAHGLDITIENPKGSERSGIGGDGKRWSVKMPASYGYVKGTEGHDGDHVDVYLGPDHASQKVYVVDQIDADTGSFDEHKVMLSFKSKSDALDTYKRAFSDGKGADRIGSVTEMSVADFRNWLKSGNTKEPMRKGYAGGGGVGRWAVPMIAPQPKPETFTDKTKRLIFSPQPYADGGSTMPLIKSGSREAISKNIQTERKAGRKPDQAIAIALSVARRAKKRARGGEVDDMPSIPGVVVRDPTENVLEGDVLPPTKSAKFDPARYIAEHPAVADVLENRMARGRAIFAPVFDAAEAVVEPTLANITNAAFAVPAYLGKVGTALGALGAGYGVAGAKDAGLLDSFISPATAQQRKGAQQPTPTAPSQLPPDLARRWQDLTGKLQKDGWLPSAERKELEGYNDIVKSAIINANKSSTESTRAADDQKQEEFNRAVQHAENVRDAKLSAGKPKPFRDTEVGKLYDKMGVVAPGLIAAGMGGLSRVASGGGSALKNYVIPGAVGTGTGVAAANWPLAHELIFQPAGNPERTAYEAYARELPPTHPRKAEWMEYARGLDKDNPARAAAAKEFYDPVKLAERSGLGAVEGLLGGVAGAEAARIPGRAIDAAAGLPGRISRAYYEGQTGAEQAKAQALKVARDVQGLRQTAGRKGQLLDEVDQLEAGATPRLTGPSAVSGEVGQATAAEKLPMPMEGPALPSGSLPSPALENPRPLVVKKTAAGYHYPKGHDQAGQFVPHDIVHGKPKSTSEGPKTLQLDKPRDAVKKEPVPRAKTSATAEDNLTDPDRLTRGQKNGGVSRATGGSVEHALALANRYASGGEVSFEGLSPEQESAARELLQTNSTPARERMLKKDALTEPVISPIDFLGAPGMPGRMLFKGIGAAAAKNPHLEPIALMSGLGHAGVQSAGNAVIQGLGNPPVGADNLKDRWYDNLAYSVPGFLAGTLLMRGKAAGPWGDWRLGGGALGAMAGTAAAISNDPETGIDAFKRKHEAKKVDAENQQGGFYGKGYSTGGNVTTGAVVGHTGGRTDAKPVSVSAGSFVVPADVVSALGEGNSLAGCKNLDKMFGGHDRAHMATGGQAVPIKISDGEYVIPPAAVSKIGNGDMDMGHRSLDKFVLAVRKQHINQLKKLPPPAR